MQTKVYQVKWEIDIDATSPEAAAEMVLEIQRDPDSLALVFDVTDENSHTYRVDLDEGLVTDLNGYNSYKIQGEE